MRKKDCIDMVCSHLKVTFFCPGNSDITLTDGNRVSFSTNFDSESSAEKADDKTYQGNVAGISDCFQMDITEAKKKAIASGTFGYIK